MTKAKPGFTEFIEAQMRLNEIRAYNLDTEEEIEQWENSYDRIEDVLNRAFQYIYGGMTNE